MGRNQIENLPLKVNGVVDDITIYKGGNITLRITEPNGLTNYAAVDTIFKTIVKKGDYFIKYENSNECIIRRNDSIIYLDCYKIPKETGFIRRN